MEYIFNLFFCSGNIDKSANFAYLGSLPTIEDALELVILYDNCVSIHETIHPLMNVHNNFTYIGNRNDCKQKLSFYRCGGGFVIEPFIIY
jgi:hypothetical protein